MTEPAPLVVEAAACTDRGRKKPKNEDFVIFYEPDLPADLAQHGRLYIVADGVGGAERGERASRYAAEKVLFEYYQSTTTNLPERLRSAIKAANVDIFSHTEHTATQNPMGTTIVAVAIRGHQLVVANVGDSRAYLIRGQQIQQITRDHSLVQSLFEEGELTLGEMLTFKKKNVINRSIGTDEQVEPTISEWEVHAGDTIFLCSDGIYKYFPAPQEVAQWVQAGAREEQAKQLMAAAEHELKTYVTAGTAQEAAQQIIHLANDRGGSDNLSAIVVRLHEPALTPPPQLVVPVSQPLPPDWENAPTQVPPSPRKTKAKAPPPIYRQSFLLMGLILMAVILVGLLVFFVAKELFSPGGLAGPGPTQPTQHLPPVSPTTLAVSVTPINQATATALAPTSPPAPTTTPTPLPPPTSAAPPPPYPPPSPPWCIYIVQSGENAQGIASRFHIDIADLKNGDLKRVAINGEVGSQLLDPGNINAQQHLIIPNLPDGSCPPGTTSQPPPG